MTVTLIGPPFGSIPSPLLKSSPVSVDSMDYASIALAVVLVLASVWWYAARRSYGTHKTAAYGSNLDQPEPAEGTV